MKMIAIIFWMLCCAMMFAIGLIIGHLMGESKAYEECAEAMEKQMHRDEDDGK